MSFKELKDEEKITIKEEFEKFETDADLLELLSSIFKVMGDPTRLKIIFLLSKSPLCVSDMEKILNMSQSRVSHQLAILRKKELIKVERIGRKAIYSLDDDHVISLFKQGYEHAEHKKTIKNK